MQRPGFQAALTRCRGPLTGGIVDAKLDLLTRSVAGPGTLLTDAREHGYVVALDLGLDLQSPNGELVAKSLRRWPVGTKAPRRELGDDPSERD